jgi:hypothetical protein
LQVFRESVEDLACLNLNGVFAVGAGKVDGKVLGKMSVDEAEVVVEQLGNGGMLSLEEGIVDAAVVASTIPSSKLSIPPLPNCSTTTSASSTDILPSR